MVEARDWGAWLTHAPTPLVVCEADSERVVFANQRFCELAGQTPEQISGRRLDELVLPQPQAAEDRASWGSPVMVATAGGTGRAVRMLSSDAEPAGDWRIHSFQEVNGLEAELAALRQSDRRLTALLDNTTAVVYAKDLDGRYLFVNRRFELLFRVSRADTMGRTDWDLFPAERAKAFRENDQRVLSSKGSLEFEELAPHQDGLHTYLSLKFALRDKRGRPYAVCGISTDITSRKQMEATLRESEERFRQVADNLDECIWVRDVGSWKLTYISPAFEVIWGQARTVLDPGLDCWLGRIVPADRDRVRRAIVEMRPGGGFQEQYQIQRPDGSVRWIRDRGVPICDVRGKVYRIAGIAEDITMRRALEQHVSAAIELEPQRIRRELHDDLGQRLTGLGYLVSSLVNKVSATNAPHLVETACLVRDGLTETLTELRRIVRGLVPVDLDEDGLKAALENLARTTTQHCDLPCELIAEDSVHIADLTVANQLYRIAQEAVNNAVKHGQPTRVEIRLMGNQERVVLEVHDNGVGFDAEPPRNGLSLEGIGLGIMRYRCSTIAARFEIVSEPQRGTTVRVVAGERDYHA